jgi:Ni,Fe-hydrogenase III large subunit
VYIEAPPRAATDLEATLVNAYDCEFATLVVEQVPAAAGFALRYFCYAPAAAMLIEIETPVAPGSTPPALGDRVYAADWHEREAEDLYGIRFAGHPFLGDFVLHDTVWPEGVAPMRRAFDAGVRVAAPGKGARWQPRWALDEEGSIAFPVGPIWSGYAESGLWLLETPGEHILQAHSRLFYKYRAVEKIAEGGRPGDVVRLAERFSGSAAFAHAWALCQALEKIAGCAVPPRARMLRAVFAELERLRYHAASIAELADATALAVGKAMAQEIEEKLLRLAGAVCGHRYLFGLCIPGGLAWQPDAGALARLGAGIQALLDEAVDLERTLAHTSSFLDRIEEMGILEGEMAHTCGVVGPVARAAGRRLDLRCDLAYGAYADQTVNVPCEQEGDGYARLRVFFAEMCASTATIKSLLAELPAGPVASAFTPVAGTALAWVEAPAGAAFHWLRLDGSGRVARWRIDPPAFRNWHAFERAFAGAAFQDFHIIMASFGLSVAENDR